MNQSKDAKVLPSMDDVLRKMLGTKPDPKVAAKKKPEKKPRKK